MPIFNAGAGGGGGSTKHVLKTGDTMTGPLVVSDSTQSTSRFTGAIVTDGGIGAAGQINGDRVTLAVWNDIAEYRKIHKDARVGRVVCPCGKGTAAVSMERLQAGPRVISDTYGFVMGKDSDGYFPVAIAGLVLAYPHEDIGTYAEGDIVCAGPNGTVSKMSRSEIMMFPDRMLGVVYEIPDYDVWENKIEVDGRIWIDLK